MKRSHPMIRILEQGLGLALGRLFAKPKAIDFHHPKLSLLIAKSCCMGDAVLSLYALREFKNIFPHCRITLLVSDRIAEVYRSAPWVDAVETLPIHGKSLLREILHPRFFIRLCQMIFRLRRQGFTGYLDWELYRMYGVWLRGMLGIAQSRGFELEGAPRKHHGDSVVRHRTEAEWKCFYHSLNLTPPENPSPFWPAPIKPTRHSSGSLQKRIGIVYGSSANWPQKQWPISSFGTLIDHLAKQGHAITLFGITSESHLAKTLKSGRAYLEDTTGTLDFSALRHKLGEMDVVIGNDTGTMHVAAAMGIPTVVLFGPTSPLKWTPLGGTAIFLKDLPCRPCYYLSSMPDCDHLSCLKTLSPEEVLAAISSRMNTFSRIHG